MLSQQVARIRKGFQYQDRICQMMTLLHEDIGGNMFPELVTHHNVGLNNIDWVMGYLVHHKDTGAQSGSWWNGLPKTGLDSGYG